MLLASASVSARGPAFLNPRVPSRLPRARRRAASATPRAASDDADVDGFNISHRVERGSCVAVGLSAMRVSQWLRPHDARCQNELDRPESALAGRLREDPAAFLIIHVVISFL